MFLVLMVCPLKVYGQDYGAIYKYVSEVPQKYENNMMSLVKYLVRPCKTDLQKAMVIFAWISLNVEYDDNKRELIQRKNRGYSWEKGKSKNWRVNNTWNTKTGVCEDIAQLYKELLSYANIRSEYVLGYAGRGLNKRNYKDQGHAWNVVYADGKRILVDPTWGNQGDSINYAWFDVDPETMIKTHYPKEQKWQLLSSPYSLSRFLSQNENER